MNEERDSATDSPETILVAPLVSSGPSFFVELEDRDGLFPQVLRGARVKPTNLRRHRYVREHFLAPLPGSLRRIADFPSCADLNRGRVSEFPASENEYSVESRERE